VVFSLTLAIAILIASAATLILRKSRATIVRLLAERRLFVRLRASGARSGTHPRPVERIFADVGHYHKIDIALSKTIRIMGEIDKVIEEYGGVPGAFVTDVRAAPST